jgi:hypothetical protein
MVKARAFEIQAVTANRLKDGAVVFLAADGEWYERIDVAATAANPAALDRLLQLAAQSAAVQFVVEPYAIDVTDETGVVRPVSLRERIRAFGPTVVAPEVVERKAG